MCSAAGIRLGRACLFCLRRNPKVRPVRHACWGQENKGVPLFSFGFFLKWLYTSNKIPSGWWWPRNGRAAISMTADGVVGVAHHCNHQPDLMGWLYRKPFTVPWN